VRALDAPSVDDEAESGREARAASAQDFLLAMIEPAERAAIRVCRRRDPETLLREEAGQKFAHPPVVIDE
jgi:hypothetical protein